MTRHQRSQDSTDGVCQPYRSCQRVSRADRRVTRHIRVSCSGVILITFVKRVRIAYAPGCFVKTVCFLHGHAREMLIPPLRKEVRLVHRNVYDVLRAAINIVFIRFARKITDKAKHTDMYRLAGWFVTSIGIGMVKEHIILCFLFRTPLRSATILLKNCSDFHLLHLSTFNRKCQNVYLSMKCTVLHDTNTEMNPFYTQR